MSASSGTMVHTDGVTAQGYILLSVHSPKAESQLVEKTGELENRDSILNPKYYLLLS